MKWEVRGTPTSQVLSPHPFLHNRLFYSKKKYILPNLKEENLVQLRGEFLTCNIKVQSLGIRWLF